MKTSEQLAPFQAFLLESKTPHETKPDGCVEIHSDIDLEGSRIDHLPEHLIVHGALDLAGTPILSLPRRLVVHGPLYVERTHITALSEYFSIAGELRMEQSQIQSLPSGLHVRDKLDISGTPITVLPQGLIVDDALDLRNTAITRFPSDLRVGYRLYAPPRLHDLCAFMQDKNDTVVISPRRSNHQRMEILSMRDNFPDLYLVVQSIPGHNCLHLTRQDDGSCTALFHIIRT
ncbi:MAG: hypothetical protein ACRYGG_12515 [Janthinobacterium lividum]